LSKTFITVTKEGFPCGERAVYNPSLLRFNSFASRAIPLERAIYPIVLKRNSGSFSSRATSRYAITSSLVSMSSAGSYLLVELDDNAQLKIKEFEKILMENNLTGKQTKDVPYHITLCYYSLDRENYLKSLMEKIEKEKIFNKIKIIFESFGLFGLNVLFLNPSMNKKLIELYDYVKINSFNENDDLAAHTTLLIDEPENILKILPKIVKDYKPIDGKIKKISLYDIFHKKFIKRIELNE
jgi:2'-5' RNA ligase